MRSPRCCPSPLLSLFAALTIAFGVASCGSNPASVDDPSDSSEDASQDASADTADVTPTPDVPEPDVPDAPGVDVPVTDIGPIDAGFMEVIEPECLEGQTRDFICPDGTTVDHCVCFDNEFQCVDSPESQCPVSSFCGDGSELLCALPMPLCETGSTPAVRNGCWECIMDELCPENVVFCGTDLECQPGEACVECATSSCPLCDDCVAACLPQGCASEDQILCNLVRPDCDIGEIAIARDGCWLCVDSGTCEPRDEEIQPVDCENNNECGIAEQCAVGPTGSRFCEDTGCISEDVLCLALPPLCEDGETRIGVNGCWACVAIDSCMRFGEICVDDQSCPPGGFCGCPDGVDCDAPQCVESGCETQAFIGCRALRPDCGPNGVAVAEDGCWACKDRESCEPIDRE